MKTFYLTYLSLLCLLVALLFSCNPVKKVMNDPSKTQQVVNHYLETNPLHSDTLIQYVKGDTITNEHTQTDTLTTVYTLQGDTVHDVKTVIKTVTQIKNIHDTTRITIKDKSFEAALQTDLIAQKTLNTNLQSELKDETAAKNKWFWILIAVSVSVIAWFTKGLWAPIISKI